MDSEYLKNAIGTALTECLAEVCAKRPIDPIEYIGVWLRNHIKNENYKKQVFFSTV